MNWISLVIFVLRALRKYMNWGTNKITGNNMKMVNYDFTLRPKSLHYWTLLCLKMRQQNWNLTSFPIRMMKKKSHVFSFCASSCCFSFFVSTLFPLLSLLYCHFYHLLLLSFSQPLFVILKMISILIFFYLSLNLIHTIFFCFSFSTQTFCFFSGLLNSYHASYCSYDLLIETCPYFFFTFSTFSLFAISYQPIYSLIFISIDCLFSFFNF